MDVNDEMVEMPWQWNDEFYYLDEDNEEVLLPKGIIIESELKNSIEDAGQFIRAISNISAYKTVLHGDEAQLCLLPKDLQPLKTFLNDFLQNDMEAYSKGCTFFGKNGVCAFMQNLALELSDSWKNINWLKREGDVAMSSRQVAAVLAYAAFLGYPPRDESRPTINFTELYQGINQCSVKVNKLRCIFHYFVRVYQNMPSDVVTYRRMSGAEYPVFSSLTESLTNVLVKKLTSDERIEACEDHLQADFANKIVGGGVLGSGCLQEEIIFATSPELIVARLFCTQLEETEALVITGSRRYSKYRVYSDSFRFGGPYFSRKTVNITVIDAKNYSGNKDMQYLEVNLIRDLKKVYTGLKKVEGLPLLPFATGDWGCGAFGGDKEFKALIQIIAASATKRDMVYFTTDPAPLENCYQLLKQHSVNVGQLYGFLKSYRTGKPVFEHVRNELQSSTAAASRVRNLESTRPSKFMKLMEEVRRVPVENISADISTSDETSF